jgi:putative membrane protein
MHWQQEGKQPDFRFSLANERTFLAWVRTALGMLAGSILLHQLVPSLQPRWIVAVLAEAVALVAAFMGTAAYLRWKQVEIAMRHDQPLPRSLLIPVLSLSVAFLALVIALLLVWA